MSRAERRRQKREEAKNPVYNYTFEQIQQIKKDATAEAANIVLKQLFCIPIIVLHEHYGELMKREVNGESREVRFADFIYSYYDDYEAGKYDLDDLTKRFTELTGIQFKEES